MDQQFGLWFQALSKHIVLLSQTRFLVPLPPNPKKHLAFYILEEFYYCFSYTNATETLDKIREWSH